MRLFILSLLVVVSGVTHASGGSVVFSGSVSMSPCKIDVIDTSAKVYENMAKHCSKASNIAS